MDNNLNARFLVDVPPATTFIAHSSELKKVYVNKMRMDFLNYNGQDYFANNCSPAREQELISNWENQAEIRYEQPGDYQVDILTGEETLIDLTTPPPALVCNEYSWNRSAVNPNLLVSVVFMDCDCTVQTVEGISSTLPDPLLICAYDMPSATAGVIAFTQLCTGNPQ